MCVGRSAYLPSLLWGPPQHNNISHISTKGGLMPEPIHWHVHVLFLLNEPDGTQMAVSLNRFVNNLKIKSLI